MTLSFPAKGISVHTDSGTLCDKHTIVFSDYFKTLFFDNNGEYMVFREAL